MRSMKQVALDMVGRTLDDQLYREAARRLYAHGEQSDGPGPAASKFYDKADRGRHAVTATSL